MEKFHTGAGRKVYVYKLRTLVSFGRRRWQEAVVIVGGGASEFVGSYVSSWDRMQVSCEDSPFLKKKRKTLC